MAAADGFSIVFGYVASAALIVFFVFSLYCMIRNAINGPP